MGSIGYTALVRIKKAGKVVHSESETFDREQAAKIWMKGREAELAKPGALTKVPDSTLSGVIDQYNREKRKTHGKTKTQVLNTIKEAALAKKRCSEIGGPELVAFAQSLKVQPQTRDDYMSHLGAIFTVARPAWGYPLDTQAMEDARRQAAAAVMSLIHSAKLNGLDPYADLKDVLQRLPTQRACDIGELLPHHWVPAS